MTRFYELRHFVPYIPIRELDVDDIEGAAIAPSRFYPTLEAAQAAANDDLVKEVEQVNKDEIEEGEPPVELVDTHHDWKESTSPHTNIKSWESSCIYRMEGDEDLVATAAIYERDI